MRKLAGIYAFLAWKIRINALEWYIRTVFCRKDPAHVRRKQHPTGIDR
jgi:hypothetical protein